MVPGPDSSMLHIKQNCVVHTRIKSISVHFKLHGRRFGILNYRSILLMLMDCISFLESDGVNAYYIGILKR